MRGDQLEDLVSGSQARWHAIALQASDDLIIPSPVRRAHLFVINNLGE